MKRIAYIHFFCVDMQNEKVEYKSVLGCMDSEKCDYIYLDNKNFTAEGYGDFVRQYRAWFCKILKEDESNVRFYDLQIC